jgi:hypothetical protein
MADHAPPRQDGTADTRWELVALPDADDARERAYVALQELAEQLEPTALAYLIAGMTTVMIVLGIAIEVENFAFGAGLLFPRTSDGQNMDALTGPLVTALGAALLMAHILVRKGSECLGRWFNRIIDVAGLAAVGMLIFGAMIFLPSTITQATDAAGGDVGAAATQASHAMGIITGALFPISALSTHAMMGYLHAAVLKIIRVRSIRQRMADIRRQLDMLSANLAAVHEEDQTITAMRAPGEMEWRTATEVAATIGEITSAMSDHCIARETLDASGGRPEIVSDLPPSLTQMPLERMHQIGGYLAKWTPQFVLSLLSQKEIPHA